MRFDAKELKTALQHLKQIVDTRSTMPILGCVLLEADDGAGTLYGTDLQTMLGIQVGELSGETASVALPVQELLRALPKAGEVTITPEGEVFSDDGGRVKLEARLAEDFPDVRLLDVTADSELDAAKFLDALTYVLPGSGDDAGREHLFGMLLDSDAGLVVTMDGYRLHLAPYRLPDLGRPVILPRPACLLLQRLLKKAGGLWFERRENGLRIDVGARTKLHVRLPDARFPPYDKVIPQEERELQLLVRGSDLAPVFEQAAKHAKAHPVKKQNSTSRKMDEFIPACSLRLVDAQLVIRIDTPDFEWESAPVGTEGGAELFPADWEIKANPRYLHDAVRQAKGIITMTFGDRIAPIMLHDGDRFALVMPCR